VDISAPPNIPWVTLDTSHLDSLASGQSITVHALIAPPASQSIGYYHDLITVLGDGAESKRIAFTAQVTTISRAVDLVIQDDQGVYVNKATVQIIKQAVSVEITEGRPTSFHLSAQKTTGPAGVVSFGSLEIGVYDVTVTAQDHQTLRSTITVTQGEGVQSETLQPAGMPRMDITPGSPHFGVVHGENNQTILTIWNRGAAPMTGITLSPPSNLLWITLGLPAVIPDIPAGGRLEIPILASPAATLANGTYQGYITVSAPGAGTMQAALSVDVADPGPRDIMLQISDPEGDPITEQGKVQLLRVDPMTVTRPDGTTYTYNPVVIQDTNPSG
jgi:hypothetical protein